MTPATLRTLREALGFTVEGFAAFLGVNRRTITRWEAVNSEHAIPDDVAEAVTALVDWTEETVDTALEALESQNAPKGTPVDLYRYVNADSALQSGVTVPWEVHCAAIGRIASELLALGYTPVVHYAHR